MKLTKSANKKMGDRLKRQLEVQFQKEGAETRVKNKIKEAFRQSAELDADGIMVAVHDGAVTLWGNVNTWAEIREAERISLAVPGVSKVDAHLYIAR